MGEVADRFIQAFEAGRRSKLAQEEHDQRSEDRKLQQQILKHGIDKLKLEDQLAARELALQNAKLMQGQPARVRTEAADLGTGITPTAEIPAQYPVEAGPRAADQASPQDLQ